MSESHVEMFDGGVLVHRDAKAALIHLKRRAEKDGFQGCSVDYWLRAEQEIANRLGETAI
jgi:hypothetical protein